MATRNSLRLPDRSMAEINITPLIDVMLALLVIFMIAAPVMTGDIHLPSDHSRNPAPQPKVLQLAISPDGIIQGHGNAMSDMEVQAELYALGANAEPGMLQLRPSADTQHQRMIDVLTLARTAGVANISIERPAD